MSDAVGCIICQMAPDATGADKEGLYCPSGHFVCGSDLNQFMSHNILSNVYKLKYNKCEVCCPEAECRKPYDAALLFEALGANERNRFLQIAHSVAADEKSLIPRVRNRLLDALNLKCPHCGTAVDPSPDACSAVSCLTCGYFYCNCCFNSFGKGQADRGSKDAHEHCASHDVKRPPDQRSAFLPEETIAAGHVDTKKAQFKKALLEHYSVDEVDSREVMLAAVLCHDELKDSGLSLRQAMGAVSAGTEEAQAESAVDTTIDAKPASEEALTPAQQQLSQLANAIHQGNATACAQLLSSMDDEDIDPNFVCGDCGENLLILALCEGDRHVAQTLLSGDRGANPNSVLVHGVVGGQRSAIYLAAEKGYVVELRAMMNMPGISASTQASFNDNFGLTAFHIAVQYGQMAVVLFLLDELHADVNMPTAERPATPLVTAVQNGREDMVSLLLSRGANINIRTREGRYPMYLAIERGHANLVKYFVNVCGVDLNAPTTMESTEAPSLWLAIQCGQNFLVPLLISLGADINKKDKSYGLAPLHYAVLKGAEDTVELLILSGADPTIQCSNGRTAMWMACESNRPGIVRYLVEKCDRGVDSLLNSPCARTQEYPIHVATIFNQPDVVAVLLNLGANLEVTTVNGLTAMELAMGRRPDLNGIISLFGSYSERKMVIDNALRRRLAPIGWAGGGHADNTRGSSDDIAEPVNGEDPDSIWQLPSTVVALSSMVVLVVSVFATEIYNFTSHRPK